MKAAPTRLILFIRRADGRESFVNVTRTVVIGADPARCDVLLDSPFVSSVHANIERKSNGYYCVQTEGKNGTLVNQIPATHPILLCNDDIIEIANFRMTCKLGTQQWDPHWAFEVRPAEHQVLIGGVELKPPLGPKEFDLLAMLWEADGKVVSHDEIGRTIWGEHMYTAVNIQKLVSDLRARVEPDRSTPRYVINVQRTGYRLERQPRTTN